MSLAVSAPLPRLNLLYSYAYLRKAHGAKPGRGKGPQLMAQFVEGSVVADMLIDSGAFTDYGAARKAAAAGKPYQGIDVGEYCEWLAEYRRFIWQYVQLDAIRDPAESTRRLEAMVRRGLRPMPVWVYPERTERVAELVDVNPHLCVAGGADARPTFMQQRYWRAFEVSGGRARIHGLGFCKFPQMYQLPLASVDSSGWSTGQRFGKLARWTARDGMKTSTRAELPTNPAMQAHLARCGVTATMLRDERTYFAFNGLPSMTMLHASLRQQAQAAGLGLKYFLALASEQQFGLVACVVASMAGRADSFDYPLARRLYAENVEGLKRDPDAANARSVELLKAHTDWRHPAPAALRVERMSEAFAAARYRLRSPFTAPAEALP